MKRSLWLAVPLAALLAAAAGAPAADVDARIAHVFQDNMVLQRDAAVPVWGWAAPGTEVEVAFAGQSRKAAAGEDGAWKVTLEAMPASSEGRDLAVRIGDAAITRHNVLVGEVWIAAGQSNMNAGGPDDDTGVYPYYASPGAGGGKPEIRVMQFGWGASLEPQTDVDPSQRGDEPWATLPESPPPKTTNLSRYFARVVRDGLGVPVGIIHVAVSGTNQAAWMDRPTLEGFPGGAEGKNFYQDRLAETQKFLTESKGDIRSWDDFLKAEAAWRTTKKGPWPGRPFGLAIYQLPSALYNTRIHPLAPFALRGVIWHQGEAGPGGPYGERLVAMARQWRKVFGQDFCFIWGTLSRHTAAQPPLEPQMSWFYRSSTNLGIRKALDVFGDDKRVALVDFYDLGNNDTHFLQKAEAGRRMGQAALTVAYGQSHVYTGPRMVDSKIEGAKATLRFDHVGEGLVYQPSIDGISGFVIKGKRGSWRWAEVKVTAKDTIELSHPEIAEIEGIGYAVAPNPHETLFNSAGLPASPFRINTGNVPYNVKGVPLVRLSGDGAAGAALSLAHVRRDGYVFELLKGRGSKADKVTVRACVGKEWASGEVEIGGQAVEATAATEDGRTFLAFEAPVDGAWIIVAAKGKAVEFRKVNRF